MSGKDSGKKRKAVESWRSAVGEDLLTRSEVEKLTGVTIRTLEHYEKQGLLCPKRTGENVANNRRLYDEHDLERLKRIVILAEYGLELAQIREVLDKGDARLVEVLEEQVDELRRQENRLRNLIMFAKFASVTDTELFEGLIAGPEDIDTYADMVRGSQAYKDAIALLRNVDDDDLQEMFDELGGIVEDFATLDEADGFRGVERQIDRFNEWWDRNVSPVDDAGFLGFWAVFEDDSLLPAIVEHVGGEIASGSLQMSAFFVCMRRLMVKQGAVIKAVAEASDGDVVLAMEQARGVAEAIWRVMGASGKDCVAGDVCAAGEECASGAELMQLCMSVMSYMEDILQDEELMAYIDYKREVALGVEDVAKVRNVFELMA